jgi:hypothetical protein
MDKQFDPYHKWLAIPPSEQPPNHYRLLGVPLFEEDADVIAQSADRQMAHVKTQASGKYADASQKILNELAKAKVALLRPEKKTAYDVQLRGEIDAANSTARKSSPIKVAQAIPLTPDKPAIRRPQPVAGAAAPRPVAAAPGSAGPMMSVDATPSGGGVAIRTDPSATSVANRSRGRKKSNWVGHVVVMVVFAVIGAAIVIGSQSDPDETASNSKKSSSGKKDSSSKKSSNDRERYKTPNGDRPSGRPNLPSQRPHRGDGTLGELVNSSDGSEPSGGQPDGSSPGGSEPNGQNGQNNNNNGNGGRPPYNPRPGEGIGRPSFPRPGFPQPGVPDGRDPVLTPERLKKQPVPDQAAQQIAQADIEEIFQKEFADARTTEERVKLAKVLFDHALETSDDPVSQFMLLKNAAEVLVSTGEFGHAWQLLDDFGGRFEFDVIPLKEQALINAIKKAKLASHHKVLTDYWLKLVDAAIEKGDYEEAVRFVGRAESSAKRASSPSLVESTDQRARNLRITAIQYRRVQRARQKFDEDPADTAAASEWGRFLCLYEGDWTKGLPLWAQGAEGDLLDLAQRDTARPSADREQLALADAWWDAGDAAPDEAAKQQLRERAGYWYRRTLPNLKSLEKVKVEQRLREIAGEAATFS